MRIKVLLLVLLSSLIAAARLSTSIGRTSLPTTHNSQSEQARPKLTIAGIYFFGYQADGLDVEKIRAGLPVQAGQQLDADEKFRSGINTVVENLTGHIPTDIAQVCCNEKGEMWLYVGLQGRSYKPMAFNPTPQGAVRLPEAAAKLEKAWEHAFQVAVTKGDFKEDDSEGYAMAHDPDERATEMAIRDYTLKNESVIYKVLASSKNADDRQTAAMFVGYAKQSQRQIDALTRASRDPDEGVRNNATRALGVLAQSSDKLARMIPATQFIDLLNSGTWTDRNKGSAVLLSLSKLRDPRLLAELRARAMPALIEVARWDQGHAMTRMILGRLAGIDEAALGKLMDDDDQMEKIIASLQKTTRR